MESTDTVQGARPADPVLKIWELAAKDRNEPPFHYAGVHHSVVVIAPDEKSARQHAAASASGTAPAGFAMREVMPETRPAMTGGTLAERQADELKRQEEMKKAAEERRAARKSGDPPPAMERVAVEPRSPWLDEGLTTCVEADLTEPRVIALDNRQ